MRLQRKRCIMTMICNTCNKTFTEYRHKTSKKVFCSPECFYKSPIPRENMNKRKGITKTSRHYAHDFAHKIFKEECMICKSNKNLETHHINNNFNDNNPKNLMMLCSSCHHRIDNRIKNIPVKAIGTGNPYLKHKEAYELNRLPNGRWSKWS